MLRPDIGTAFPHARSAPAGAPAPAARPADGHDPQPFDAVMAGMRREIEAFIQRGSPDIGLSAGGSVHRMRQMLAATSAPAAPMKVAGRVAAGDLHGTAAELRRLSRIEHVPLSGGEPASMRQLSGAQRSFLDRVRPLAQEAGDRLGVAPELVLAQAALESGWGSRPLRDEHGTDTHNLFGIKAGSAWQGAVAEVLTTEFDGGVAVKTNERFRSYPDHASAFQDFTRLLLNAPRYRTALNAGADAEAYARGLVKGGYATDPAYADKLVRLARGLQSGD